MSTNDVPGANNINNDILAAGCWAEHNDGSLLYVEGNENDNVIFSIFDMRGDPPLEYRDVMSEPDFKRTFSWDINRTGTDLGIRTVPMLKWTWHDKTPFPWTEKVLKAGGFVGGQRYASAAALQTAARKVAQSLSLHGHSIKRRSGQIATETPRRVMDKLRRAFSELRK